MSFPSLNLDLEKLLLIGDVVKNEDRIIGFRTLIEIKLKGRRLVWGSYKPQPWLDKRTARSR